MNDENDWWITSAGLQAHCPGIEKSVGWSLFKCEYDKPEMRDHRLDAWKISRPPWCLYPRVMELKALSEFVLGEQNESVFHSSVTRGLSVGKASEILARKVLDLVSRNGVDSVVSLANEVKEVYRPNHEQRNVADAVWALACFCERTGHLPKKKELNIEANRIDCLIRKEVKRVIILGGKKLNFGEIYEKGKRFYGGVNTEESLVVYLCRETEWQKERWEKSDYSTILKKAGLKDLRKN